QTTMLALSSYSELMPQLLSAALTVYRSHVERIDPLCGHESWSSGEILVFDDRPQNAPSRKQPRHRTRMRVVVLHRDSTARVQQSRRRRHNITNHREPTLTSVDSVLRIVVGDFRRDLRAPRHIRRITHHEVNQTVELGEHGRIRDITRIQPDR